MLSPATAKQLKPLPCVASPPRALIVMRASRVVGANHRTILGHATPKETASLLQRLVSVFLPVGFPDSVTDDYVGYGSIDKGAQKAQKTLHASAWHIQVLFFVVFCCFFVFFFFQFSFYFGFPPSFGVGPCEGRFRTNRSGGCGVKISNIRTTKTTPRFLVGMKAAADIHLDLSRILYRRFRHRLPGC